MKEKKTDMTRIPHYNKKFVWIIIVVMSLLSSYFIYNQVRKSRNKIQISLESISYEALKMAAKKNIKHLAFRTHNHEEVISYLNSLPKLKFKPFAFKKIPKDWSVIGASFLDYNTEQATVVSYENNYEKIYLFSLADKPNLYKEKFQFKNSLEYSSYGSTEINLVIWKNNKKSVNILAGWMSIENLVQFIINSQ